MLKYILAFILFLHGLIHLMGFAKAYNYAAVSALTKPISKHAGTLWLFAGLLFIVAVLLFLLKKDVWLYMAFVAVLISQILIIGTWQDAKFGTIGNVIVLLAIISAWGSAHFEKQFNEDVKAHLLQSAAIKTDLLTETDIQNLPLPVQKYMRYSQVINQPKVKNMRVLFDGQMREKGKDWFTFQSVQYNFFDNPARLFFMKAKIFGLPVPGYHCYQNEKAAMQIKMLGLFNLVNIKGAILNKAETVTVFNDMCLMVPATLIDKRIEWKSRDSLSAQATFTNGVNKISATLYFNEEGQLINFISDDRYAVGDMKRYRFSTPVKEYAEMDGGNRMKYGETIWHYPDGEFVYGKFTLKSMEYNVTEF